MPVRKSAAQQDLNIWKSHGIPDAYYQRTIFAVLWTVMLVVALAFLAIQFLQVMGTLNTAAWYPLLYLIATVVVITYTWVQVAWGSLVLPTRLSVVGTLIIIISGLALWFAAINIANPPLWIAGVLVASLGSLADQFYLYRTGAWNVFPANKLQKYKNGLIIYAGQVLLVALFLVHMLLVPTTTVYIVYGFVAIAVSVVLLVMQQRGMNEEKQELKIP